MGKKTHPHGLRVGIHRKWSNSWYGDSFESKNLFFQHRSVEEILKTLLYLYNYTKISAIKCILLVDVKIFKYSVDQVLIFVLFYKFRTKRRRQAVKIKLKKKTNKIKFLKIKKN